MPNFGDLFVFEILNKINASKIVNVRGTTLDCGPALVGSGSILGGLSYPNSIIWGSGFMESKVFYDVVVPKQVFAYRGPKSNFVAQSIGWPVSERYGDPGLLASHFWPRQKTKYRFGIVPHYNHRKYFNNINPGPEIKIIDVCSKFESILNEISACEIVFSTSLHGLIVANSYHIPSCWMKLPEKLRPIDDEFKFYDYLEGIGLTLQPVHVANGQDCINSLSSISRYAGVSSSEQIAKCQDLLVDGLQAAVSQITDA